MALEPAGDDPVSAEVLAHSLDAADYRDVTWREGTNRPLTSRFAAVRVGVARGMQYCDQNGC